MTTGFFGDATRATYEGPDSTNPLAFRHYNPDEMLMGKRMEDHLRFACAYWHSFCWPGGDPFGGQTFERPVRPEGANFAENTDNLNEIADYFAEKMESSKTKLLWGTADCENLYRRYSTSGGRKLCALGWSRGL